MSSSTLWPNSNDLSDPKRSRLLCAFYAAPEKRAGRDRSHKAARLQGVAPGSECHQFGTGHPDFCGRPRSECQDWDQTEEGNYLQLVQTGPSKCVFRVSTAHKSS